MNKKKTLFAAGLLVLATAVPAAEVPTAEVPATEIPTSPLRRALFGDLHLHTSYSFDAYVMLGARTTPDEAYRFARGDSVPYLDHEARRRWPLDFMAVTDHAENLGLANDLSKPDSALSRSEAGKAFFRDGPMAFWMAYIKLMEKGRAIPGFDPSVAVRSAWQEEIDAANRNYVPGKFTTFIAYEWTSYPSGQNLHRNVIFRGAKAPAPFSALDSMRPEDLWKWLGQVRAQGHEALAIPHNANVSNGLMYDWNDSDGKAIDQDYAMQRAANEPLAEIGQGKGQSETHPLLSPNDEFAGFEIFDYLLASSRKGKIHGSYVREAYGRGLQIERRVGVNPFKFGVVGGSDFHNGLSTSDEESFAGGSFGIDADKDLPAGTRAQEQLVLPKPSPGGDEADVQHVLTASGNLTGVWAEQNTRESIYAALRRKETFATSGTRLQFRLFGAWQFDSALLRQRDWLARAYAQGVPMGGDLPARPSASAAPRFAVWALKDPDGANLDRIQVIKVWLEQGAYREKIFDVAASDGRRPDAAGHLPAVGNTVDLHTGAYKNTIGATELGALWQDPEFDPRKPALYYLRVLEIPTPRWTTLLAVKRGLPLSTAVPATVQERGWSSPIWYTPATGS